MLTLLWVFSPVSCPAGWLRMRLVRPCADQERFSKLSPRRGWLMPFLASKEEQRPRIHIQRWTLKMSNTYTVVIDRATNNIFLPGVLCWYLIIWSRWMGEGRGAGVQDFLCQGVHQPDGGGVRRRLRDQLPGNQRNQLEIDYWPKLMCNHNSFCSSSHLPRSLMLSLLMF